MRKSTAGKRPWREWSESECDILRAHYQTGGMKACLTLLHDRKPASIYEKASLLGQRRQNRRRLGSSCPRIDEGILSLYANPIPRGAIAAMARRIGRPPDWIQRRAAHLGCAITRIKEREWTTAENEILEQASHLMPSSIRIRLLRAGYRRTVNAITCQRTRLGLGIEDNGYMTANALGPLLGVSGESVKRWIRQGHLSATPRGTARDKTGEIEVVHERNLRRMIIANPYLIDFRRIPPGNRGWFVELLSNRAPGATA